MKSAMITYLEKLNQTSSTPISRLYFQNGDQINFVEDFTYFIPMMSKELSNALSKGKTLTNKLALELEGFVVEGTY